MYITIFYPATSALYTALHMLNFDSWHSANCCGADLTWYTEFSFLLKNCQSLLNTKAKCLKLERSRIERVERNYFGESHGVADWIFSV